LLDVNHGFNTASPNLVVNVDLVNLQFTVKDERGKLVTQIDPSSLRLFEDEHPQTIRYFSHDTDLPLTIGILVDTSNSIRERFSFERASALEFLTSAIRRNHDAAFLMTFDSDIRVIRDSTDDPAILISAFDLIRPRGATKLYDAIGQACTEKLALVDGRRVLLVISDGDDDASVLNLRKVLKVAQNQDVMVYAVSTNPHGLSVGHLTGPDKVLKRLAEETGGQAFFPASSVEFAQSFERISRETRSQFTLAYNSSNPTRDGTFRKIRIEPNNRKWVLRTRKGYFAPTR
jgi:VWFA-related protein